jgi:hypothetical protein
MRVGGGDGKRRTIRINRVGTDNLKMMMNYIFIGARVLPDWHRGATRGAVFGLMSFRTGTKFRRRIWICRHKYMIFRRLGPFSTFFAPFLNHKGLISRRLQGMRGKISHEGSVLAHGHDACIQNVRDSSPRLLRVQGAANVPAGPALFRVQLFLGRSGTRQRMGWSESGG